MRGRTVVVMLLTVLLQAQAARAQWADPKLVAGQMGVHVTVSFLGKILFGDEPVGRALREAVREGAMAGVIAHTGYCLTGRSARLALPGKLLVQKANLMTRRSIEGLPLFDESLYSDWVLTHSLFHLRYESGRPRVELDVVNAVFTARYAFADGFALHTGRSLLSGSLVFENQRPPLGVDGYYVPGVIWIDGGQWDDESILRHELIHSVQAERGAALYDWHGVGLRLNPLAFASGVPAFLEGWPNHDRRLHEREAHWYTDRW
jgi:hypothetical protein